MNKKILLLSCALPLLLNNDLLAQPSRLVAESHWSFGGTAFNPIDSSWLNYSNGRGGDLTHQLKYDNLTTWVWADTAYQNGWYYVQTFDSTNNNLMGSIAEMWDAGSMSWKAVTNTLYTYDSANRVATMILQNWNGSMWVPSTEHVYSYTSAGKLFLDLLQTWNSTVLNWDPSSQKTYYYDGSATLLNETDQAFIGGTPVFTTQYAYTYSAMKNTTTVSTWNGSAWNSDSLYTSIFDSSTGQMTIWSAQSYDSTNLVWMNGTLRLYSNFVPGTALPQTVVYQNWDSAGAGLWVNMIQYTNTYNSNGQLTSSTGQSWNVVGLFEYAAGDPMARYYYETYASTGVTVRTAIGNGGQANVYPVPAQNMLHVDLKWDEAQSAGITMYDLQGRVVRQWSAPMGTQSNSAVSVNGLADGTYILKINGTTGQVVKQLVIAH